MNYQEFQEQIESTSGLSDWKYYKGESDFSYFRAMRNNDQFRVIYSASDHRYDWTAERTHETMKIEMDCFSLKDAIEFLNMPIVINKPRQPEDLGIAHAIAILLICLGIGWIGWTAAIATVKNDPNYLRSSSVERS